MCHVPLTFRTSVFPLDVDLRASWYCMGQQQQADTGAATASWYWGCNSKLILGLQQQADTGAATASWYCMEQQQQADIAWGCNSKLILGQRQQADAGAATATWCWRSTLAERGRSGFKYLSYQGAPCHSTCNFLGIYNDPINILFWKVLWIGLAIVWPSQQVQCFFIKLKVLVSGLKVGSLKIQTGSPEGVCYWAGCQNFFDKSVKRTAWPGPSMVSHITEDIIKSTLWITDWH